MAKYRYIKNVKPSWNMTVAFTTVDVMGAEVTVKQGEVVDLDTKTAKDLSEYFILEKLVDESAPVVANPKAATKALFNESLKGGE